MVVEAVVSVSQVWSRALWGWIVRCVAGSRSAGLNPPSFLTVTISVLWKTVRTSSPEAQKVGASVAATLARKSLAVRLTFAFPNTSRYAARACSGKAVPLKGEEPCGGLMLTAYALAVGSTDVQL